MLKELILIGHGCDSPTSTTYQYNLFEKSFSFQNYLQKEFFISKLPVKDEDSRWISTQVMSGIQYLYCVEPPCLDVIPKLDCHPHEPVECNPQQFIFLLSMESDNKERDSIIRERLPSLDKVHFCFHQVQIFDIGMRFQDLLAQLKCTTEWVDNLYT